MSKEELIDTIINRLGTVATNKHPLGWLLWADILAVLEEIKQEDTK